MSHRKQLNPALFRNWAKQRFPFSEEFRQTVSEFGMTERPALIFKIPAGKMWVTWYNYAVLYQ